jgi:hypothetical protein
MIKSLFLFALGVNPLSLSHLYLLTPRTNNHHLLKEWDGGEDGRALIVV